MLSGQRRNEVASMEWREIDGDVWTIPTNKDKGHRNHEVRISAALVRLIEAQPRHDSFVFSTRPETHIKPVSKLKNRISAETGLEDLRFHDIRRAAATILGDTRGTAHAISMGHYQRSLVLPIPTPVPWPQAAEAPGLSVTMFRHRSTSNTILSSPMR
jgi:integrase